MATTKSVLRTAQDESDYKLHTKPSMLPAQQRVMRGEDSYTCLGTEVTGDKIDLYFPRTENLKLIPEQCRITNPTGSGSVIIGAKLQKVATDANGTETVTDLTAVADVSNNSVAFARISDGSLPVIGANDSLRVLLSTTASTTFTMAAGQVINFELQGVAPGAL